MIPTTPWAIKEKQDRNERFLIHTLQYNRERLAWVQHQVQEGIRPADDPFTVAYLEKVQDRILRGEAAQKKWMMEGRPLPRSSRFSISTDWEYRRMQSAI